MSDYYYQEQQQAFITRQQIESTLTQVPCGSTNITNDFIEDCRRRALKVLKLDEDSAVEDQHQTANNSSSIANLIAIENDAEFESRLTAEWRQLAAKAAKLTGKPLTTGQHIRAPFPAILGFDAHIHKPTPQQFHPHHHHLNNNNNNNNNNSLFNNSSNNSSSMIVTTNNNNKNQNNKKVPTNSISASPKQNMTMMKQQQNNNNVAMLKGQQQQKLGQDAALVMMMNQENSNNNNNTSYFTNNTSNNNNNKQHFDTPPEFTGLANHTFSPNTNDSTTSNQWS
jgi:hypothetical protein